MTAFNVKQAIENSESKFKKGALSSSLFVGFVIVIGFFIADLVRYLSGKKVVLIEAPAMYVAFMLVPVIFSLYLYVRSILRYDRAVGQMVFTLYAKHKHVNNEYSIARNQSVIVQKLLSLNNKTYSQLTDEQKAIAYFGVAFDYCSPQWIVDKETFKKIPKATSLFALESILRGSGKVINMESKFIKRRPSFR